MGSTAGIEGVAAGAVLVVLAPNVKGALVIVPAFLSLSPVSVPNEKRDDVGAAAEVVVVVVAAEVVVVEVVDAVEDGAPKVKGLELVVEVAVEVAGVLVAALVLLNVNPVVLDVLAALVEGVSFDLMVVVAPNGDAVTGVVVLAVSDGAAPNEENGVKVVFADVSDFESPKVNTPAAGFVAGVVVVFAGLLNENAVEAGVVEALAVDVDKDDDGNVITGVGLSVVEDDEPNKGAEAAVGIGAGEPNLKGSVVPTGVLAFPESATVVVVGVVEAAMENALLFKSVVAGL